MAIIVIRCLGQKLWQCKQLHHLKGFPVGTPPRVGGQGLDALAIVGLKRKVGEAVLVPFWLGLALHSMPFGQHVNCPA